MINNIGVILGGGKGERFNNTIPKQFVKLNGKYVISYSIEEFIKSKLFDKIILVLPSSDFKYIAEEYNLEYVIGGNNRTKSIYNAIKYVKKYNPINILFHDAARPLLKAEDFEQYFDLLKKYKGIITAEKITDSLYPILDRKNYKLIQTPEVFKFKELYKRFDINKDYTAIYQYFDYKDINFIYLNHPNDKITYPIDLYGFEHLIKYNMLKINPVKLKNKKILILGSFGGIGQSLVRELRKEKSNNLYLPSHAEIDVEKITSIDLLKKYPDIDVIINLAGVCFKDSDGILKQYSQTMNVNLKSNLVLIEYSKLLKKRINIVFISSSSATKGREGLTTYSASKVALHSIVESQSKELSQSNIYLNCICPEKVNTVMLKSLPNYDKLNKEEILEPEEVIKVILSYCNTKEHGQIIYLRKGMKI